MRNVIPSMLVAIFILIGGLHSALAAPYWIKPGVYIEYIAQRYDPYIQYRVSHGDKPDWVTTSLMIYNYSGVLYVIKTYNDTVIRFNLSDENNEYIISHVQIELTNVTVMTVLPKGVHPPAFWKDVDVLSAKTEKSHDPDFKDWTWYIFKLREVTITGSHLIREADMQVVKDGKAYGHTMLFDSPLHPLEKGSAFSKYPFSTVIGRVTVDNKNSKKWKNITYYPPLKTVVTEGYSFNLTQPFGKGYPIEIVQMATLIYTFDASDGNLVFTPNGGPDLWAVGILSASFSDEYALYQAEVRHDDSYATGLVLKLFKTSAKRLNTISFRKPDVKTAYVFHGSLAILLIIVGLTKIKKRRE
ncbi:hypothetical protein [Thermococcus camini]|uniref:Uncharacterized protein n=1 Tax=Thermococcus camini TaxID=2016373 RepID=A0A7G2D7B1_9EURY|nr:hypothetical protein [Thermococcus camini]CAD5244323.1 conserved exported protein of unknown function [Thermococcus camini]